MRMVELQDGVKSGHLPRGISACTQKRGRPFQDVLRDWSVLEGCEEFCFLGSKGLLLLTNSTELLFGRKVRLFSLQLVSVSLLLVLHLLSEHRIGLGTLSASCVVGLLAVLELLPLDRIGLELFETLLVVGLPLFLLFVRHLTSGAIGSLPLTND